MSDDQGSPEENDEWDAAWNDLPLDDLSARSIAGALGLEWNSSLGSLIARSIAGAWRRSEPIEGYCGPQRSPQELLEIRISWLNARRLSNPVRAHSESLERLLAQLQNEPDDLRGRQALVGALGLFYMTERREPHLRDGLLETRVLPVASGWRELIRDIADGVRQETLEFQRTLEAVLAGNPDSEGADTAEAGTDRETDVPAVSQGDERKASPEIRTLVLYVDVDAERFFVVNGKRVESAGPVTQKRVEARSVLALVDLDCTRPRMSRSSLKRLNAIFREAHGVYFEFPDGVSDEGRGRIGDPLLDKNHHGFGKYGDVEIRRGIPPELNGSESSDPPPTP